MISIINRWLKKERKAKFSKGDPVTNGSVTVFIVEDVIDDGKSFHYRVNNSQGDKKTYHESLLDMVWAIRDKKAET